MRVQRQRKDSRRIAHEDHSSLQETARPDRKIWLFCLLGAL